jgi:hypothetical protein
LIEKKTWMESSEAYTFIRWEQAKAVIDRAVRPLYPVKKLKHKIEKLNYDMRKEREKKTAIG